MGYVHPDRPDIFLSYAHVDDEPEPAFADRPGWVTALVRSLEKRLAKKLGRVDAYDLWRDSKLAGHVELTPEILGRLREAAVLLLVLSPGYLASEWCIKELAAFREEIRRRKAAGGRTFVIEFDRVDPNKKPHDLADLKGYRFWVEDPDSRNPETLGYPIVREKDEEYYKQLNDLCIELVRELEGLKQSEQAAPESAGPAAPDTRPVVYLAEVTEDLEARREAVRRHLDQAGIRVAPESETSRDDPEAYRVAVDADLARSVAFVQLLSATPGRRLKGSEASYVALQHERAVEAGKSVLQWRSRGLDVASEEIPEDHRRRLNGPEVVAADLSEFNGLVVDAVKKLTAPPPPARTQVDAGGTDTLIFVDAEATETDLKAAKTIIDFFESRGMGALLPARGATPDATRQMLKTRMLACDALVLVHGDNPDWLINQWTQFRKLKADREAPVRAIGVCDLPPADRSMIADDVIRIPSAHVIDCRDGLALEKFATFLKSF